MDKGLRVKPEPFDSFRLVYLVLKISGYSSLHGTWNRCVRFLHESYRVIVLIIVFIYASQHGFYVWMVRTDTPKFMSAVMLELPEIVLCCKAWTMYKKSKRIDELNQLMKDPIFGPRNKTDELYIKENSIAMNKLMKFALCGLSCVASFWIAGPIVKRLEDETTQVPTYMPFSVDTWPRFLLANFLDTCTILWIGYGHFGIDCAIATYYAQARLQVRIINYNLKRLFDDVKEGRAVSGIGFKYLDDIDDTVQERFVHYVNRYERVCWFTREVTAIFGQAISFQLFVTSFSTCLVVYQMSSTSVASVEFAFMMGYYLACQFQIFVYCYYGGNVEYESRFTSDSLYLGNWLSLSPRFRRQLLIALTRWIKPITPRVSSIVPLSLTTFISLCRSAYTLYTVLKSSNNREEGRRSLAF